MLRPVRTLAAVLVLAISLVASPTDGGASASPTGSVSGTITVPAGVDPTKVQVNLLSSVPENRQWTTPDADGRYAFTALPAGSYNVEFIGWGVGLIYDSWGDGVWPLQLAEGQARTGIDVTLQLGATLSGTVHTNGRFDMSRVTVTTWGTPGVFPDVRPGPDGRWVMRGVPSGNFIVNVDGRAAGLPSVDLPSNGTYRHVTAPEHISGLDVTLTGAVGSIAGRITVPSGDPAGVVVRAAGPMNWDTRASVARDGTFRLDGLPVGGYALVFLVGGASPDQVLEYWPDAATYDTAATAWATNGGTTWVEARVGASTTVALTSSKPVARVGDALRLTARVESTIGPPGTGSVEFRDGSGVIGTAPVVGDTASLDLPALPAGEHALSARFLGGGLHDASEPATMTQWVSVPTPPVVTAVDLPAGGRLGGTEVAVRGAGLTDTTSVTFGGAPGSAIEVISPSELRVTTPAGSGNVPVAVTTTTGTSPAADAARFTYTDVGTQSPTRVLDTWTIPGRVGCTRVAGMAGVPEGATGVLLNVATVRPNGPGYVVVYPDAAGTGATTPPAGSTVNFEPGADVANTAFVALPPNGRVCYSTQGAPLVRLVWDVAGYTLETSGIVTQAPQRLLDTRDASHVGQVTGPVAPRRVYTIDVAGRTGVPADAAAVVLNVAVTGVSSVGHLRVFTGGTGVPGTSVLNYAPGKDKANGTIVALGADGTLSFWSDTAGTAQVILDVVGYVARDSAYAGVTPTRVLDTRPATQTGPIAGALAPRQVYSMALRGVGPVPAGATAVLLNVTAIGPTSNGNLRVYPDSDGTGRTPPPGASSINYIPGRDIPNQVVVALPSDGRINLYNDAVGSGTVHLAIDVVGYIGAGGTG